MSSYLCFPQSALWGSLATRTEIPGPAPNRPNENLGGRAWQGGGGVVSALDGVYGPPALEDCGSKPFEV